MNALVAFFRRPIGAVGAAHAALSAALARRIIRVLDGPYADVPPSLEALRADRLRAEAEAALVTSRGDRLAWRAAGCWARAAGLFDRGRRR